MDILAACRELASTGFGDTLTISAVGAAMLLAGLGVLAVRSRNKALVLLLVVGLTSAAVITSPTNADTAVAACHADGNGDGGGGGDDGGGGGDDGGITVTNAANNGSWGENYHPIYCVGFQTPMVQIGDTGVGDFIVFDPGVIPGAISDYTWSIGGVEANSWGPYGADTVIVWHDESLYSSGQTVTVVVTDGVSTYQFNATFN